MTANPSTPPGIDPQMRRQRLLYGDGRPLEPADESLETIAHRLANSSLPVHPATLTRPPVLQKFLARFDKDLRRIAESKIVEAEVTECNPGSPVLLDLSPGSGLLNPAESRPADLHPGRRLWVAVQQPAEGRSRPQDRLICSLRLAQGRRALSVIESMWAAGLWMEARGLSELDSEGWVVDIDGFPAVLPLEESEDRMMPLGRVLRVLILRYDPIDSAVLVSQKKYTAQDRAIQRKSASIRLRPGQILTATVRSVGAAAVQVEVDGVRADLPAMEAGFGPPEQNLAAFSVGQKVPVMVIESCAAETDRVVVGHRQLYPDPWVFIRKVVQPGSKVDVTVAQVLEDRILVNLKEGIPGEIHWKEAGWQIEDPTVLPSAISPGQALETICLAVQRELGKVQLSIKSTQPDPLSELIRRYVIGSRWEVRSVHCTDARARVITDDGFFGFILPEDISWSGPVSPRQFFSWPPAAGPAAGAAAPRSRQITAEVLAIDPATRLIRFGVKQIRPDPFLILLKEITIGNIYDGKIVKLIPAGALVEIRRGLVGLMRKNDFSEDEPSLSEGQSLKVMVMSIHLDQRRMSLSRKAVVDLEARREIQPFLTDLRPEDRKVSMKDLLSADLLKRLMRKRE